MKKITNMIMKNGKYIFTAVKYIFTVLLGLLLAANIISIVQTVVLGEKMPMLFGYGRAVVLTGSMEPAVMPGDMVIVHEQDSYLTGDVVMYKANSYITHRIVETTDSGYITQGDANNAPDGEIRNDQVVGRVTLVIPKAGYVTEFLTTPLGVLALIAVLIIMIELPVLLEKFRRGGAKLELS